MTKFNILFYNFNGLKHFGMWQNLKAFLDNVVTVLMLDEMEWTRSYFKKKVFLEIYFSFKVFQAFLNNSASIRVQR